MTTLGLDPRVVFNTVNKNEVLTCFKKFIVAVGGRPKKLRVDNGGEFINGEFLTFCAEREILVERTMPYSAEENGRQERQWYTLDNMMRAMLIEADCLTKPLAKEKLDDFRTLLMHVESAK